MKVIVAGSRGLDDPALVRSAIEHAPFEITEVVSGGARGVDQLGERWAHEHDVPFERFMPDYDQAENPKGAPIRRNKRMAEYADALIAVWDGESRGTEHMIDIAENQDLPRYVEKVTRDRRANA